MMNVIFTKIEYYWFPIFIFILGSVTLFSLLPLPQLPHFPGTDKTHHFISYALVIFPVILRKPNNYIWLIGLVIVWSGGIELIQPWVNRYAEWADFRANILGVLLGTFLGFCARKYFR